jgi:HSP20 family molecular chaperone IbpA
MLEQVMAERRRGGGEWMPVNVFEDGDAVVVEAALPRCGPRI